MKGSSWRKMSLDIDKVASDGRSNSSDVRVDKCSPKIDRPLTVNFAVGAKICAVQNSISAKGNLIMMLERTLYLAKYILCLSLITRAAFPVNAVTNLHAAIHVEVKVPEEKEVGSYADLKCEWRVMGNEPLYSVRWYKDDHEFFRFAPKNQQSIQTFSQQGVKLDKDSMSQKSIRLMDLTLNSTGQYKCEVSTEGPSFATEYKTGNLTVIALPDRGPNITGLSSHYAVGENVTANCTARPSIPKAKLHWLINGNPVPKEYVVVHPSRKTGGTLGVPNSIGLRMDANQRHFEGGDGSVSIRCVSIVGKRQQEVEKTVHMAYVNNQRLSAGDHLRGGGTSIKMTQNSQERCFAVILVVVGLCIAT